MKYLRKLALNLCIIVAEITLIWVSYNAFSHYWQPMAGALIVLGNLTLLVLLIHISKRRGFRQQRPGQFKTTLVAILAVGICTFVGVQPLATYKDSLIENWGKVQIEQSRETVEVKPSPTKEKPMDALIPQGVYVAGIGKETITFEGNRLFWVSAAGKLIYNFEIVGAIITLTDIATGEIERRTFEYDKQDNFVVINDRLFCEEILIETLRPEVPVRELAVASQIHQLVNEERRKRRIPPTKWSDMLARQAQSQVEHCAEIGDLQHSNRYAFEGGENLFWSPGTPYARAIVDTWLGSTQGHREYLLSPRVKYAGVGVVYKSGGTFAAWAFSDMALFTEFGE